MTITASLKSRGLDVLRAARIATAAVALFSACGESSMTEPPAPEIAVRGIVILGDSPVRMSVAESLRLTAMGQTNGGDVFLSTGVRWESSDPTIASIDSTGLVRANTVGQVVVTARYRTFSMTVHLTSSPAFNRMRLTERPVAVGDSGLVFNIAATFSDVNNVEITVPWAIEWSVVQGTDTLPFEILDAPYDHRIRVEAFRPGDITVRMTTNGFTMTRQFRSWVGVAPFTVERFEMVQQPAGSGWIYMPDLHLRSDVDDLIITRLEFRTASPVRHACGRATLTADGGATPLFDFQPYNFAWQGEPVTVGTPAQVTITAEHGEQVFEVTVTGTYTVTGTNTILDYGTAGFVWRQCP